jgi:hypothetical protein
MGDLRFPAHKAALHLTHNNHLSYYRTVAQEIEDEACDYTDWVNEEQKQKAIDTNDCWCLHWYPHTPIGFNTLAAHDLDVLLAAALKMDEADG